MEFTFKAVQVLVTFILPGFFALSVRNMLYKKKEKYGDIELVVKSLFHSAWIYAIALAICLKNPLANIELKTEYELLYIFIKFVIISFGWGILVVFCQRFLEKLFETHDNLGVAAPPNLYAAIFDPVYNDKASNGMWITYKWENKIYEGYLDYVDVADEERLLGIKGIKELDEEGNVLKDYPEEFEHIVNLKKLGPIEGFEIKYIE